MAGSRWSWERRRRLALVLNASLVVAGVTAAAVASDASDWRPTELLLILAGFALASELLSVSVIRPPTRDSSWRFTSTAPFVLAVVFLGPAPSLAIGLASLTLAWFLERSPWRDLVANYAQYSVLLPTAAFLADALITSLDLSWDDPALIPVVVGIYLYVLVVSFIMLAGYGALANGESIRLTGRHEWRIELTVEAPIVLITALTAYVYGTAGLVGLAVLAGLQLVFTWLARELPRSYERAAALRRRGDELIALHSDLARHANRISALSASRGRLVGQILSAEQGERRRLAEALHDEAMQNLLAARQDLADKTEATGVERAQSALDATINQLRDAIFELHPAVFEHVGLAAAVEAVADRAARRGGFEVTVEAPHPDGGSERDLLLFTISRELLANAAAHSRASHASLRISELPDEVCLEVSDDGCGFEPERLRWAVEDGHIGLASIAERIEALGGTFVIDSQPGRGTAIRACIPRHADASFGRKPGRNLATDEVLPVAEVPG
jgi:two-component system NarL family sensor kinase